MVFFYGSFQERLCINISKTVKDKISYIDPNKKENQFQNGLDSLLLQFRVFSEAST
jgi:hypothetical protein